MSRRRTIASISVAAAIVGVVMPRVPAADAHPMLGGFLGTPCGNQVTEPRAFSANLTYRADDFNSNSNARTAADNAAAAWTSATDINFSHVSSSPYVNLTWNTDPNTGLAGFSQVGAIGCSLYTHANWINLNHISASGQDNVGEKQCILAHEMGHSIGLSHNNQSPNTNFGAAHAAADSIMRGGEHVARCHSSPPGAPRAADVVDINGKY